MGCICCLEYFGIGRKYREIIWVTDTVLSIWGYTYEQILRFALQRRRKTRFIKRVSRE